MITLQEKQEISQMLGRFVKKAGSQNKAAVQVGVSTATVSQVINSNWELVSDEMWRKISAAIGHRSSGWQAVETRDFKMITATLLDAQNNSNVYAITGDAGSGKTYALKQYSNSHKRAYLLQCNEYWNRKYFLSELMIAMGIDSSGYTVAEMMSEIVGRLKKVEAPLIILDEADKLSDQVLYFFITLYNQLEDHCGIVMCATSHLEKRIKKGVKINKKGYREIYSRIGRKFLQLSGVGFTDVTQICLANGIEDKAAMKSIFQDCEEDLRRVKRKIHAYRMIQKQKTQN